MKKIVRLTESDLVRLVKRVIKEQTEEELMNATPISIANYGMEPREAIALLTSNGLLTRTDGRPLTQPFNGGLARLLASNEAANLEASRLASKIAQDVKRKGGQLEQGKFYLIDIILGFDSRNISGSITGQNPQVKYGKEKY